MLVAAPALACPNCAVGIQARSDVWNEDFWFHLLIAVMPFLVIGAVCIYVEQRERARDNRNADIAQEPARGGPLRRVTIARRIGS